jgi:sirohydrochlorin ferrochelatase
MTPPSWTSSASELMSEIVTQFSTRVADNTRGTFLTDHRRSGRQARRTGRTKRTGRTGADRRPVLVAVAHGSRDPAAFAEIRRLLALAGTLRPDLDIRLAHLGLNEPLLPDVLAALTGEAVLVPLLLGRGYHVKVDIPQILAAAPHITGLVAGPLGPHPLLTEALHARLTEAGWDDPATVRERRREARDAVVLAAAGSRDRASAEDTEAQARLLAARLHVPVVPGYVAAASPSVPEAVASLAARGYRRIAVSGYFTAPGDFARLASAAGDWLTAAPLGAHDAMARLLLTRYDETAPAVLRPLAVRG